MEDKSGGGWDNSNGKGSAANIAGSSETGSYQNDGMRGGRKGNRKFFFSEQKGKNRWQADREPRRRREREEPKPKNRRIGTHLFMWRERRKEERSGNQLGVLRVKGI